MRRSPIWLVCVLALLGVACAPEGPTAYIDGNIPVDTECIVDSASDVVIAIGSYDIAERGEGNTDSKSKSCSNSYVLNLRVNSYLRSNADDELGRAEPNILQVDSAEVRLMTLAKEDLLFRDGDVQLPNPFRVVTAATVQPTQGTQASTAIATVEAIPAAYAEFLDDFIGTKILIETQLFGTTTGDVDVEMKPFTYAVDICDGCMTMCLMGDITGAGGNPEDITTEQCNAQILSGMDGRICIDTEC